MWFAGHWESHLSASILCQWNRGTLFLEIRFVKKYSRIIFFCKFVYYRGLLPFTKQFTCTFKCSFYLSFIIKFIMACTKEKRNCHNLVLFCKVYLTTQIVHAPLTLHIDVGHTWPSVLCLYIHKLCARSSRANESPGWVTFSACNTGHAALYRRLDCSWLKAPFCTVLNYDHAGVTVYGRVEPGIRITCPGGWGGRGLLYCSMLVHALCSLFYF